MSKQFDADLQRAKEATTPAATVAAVRDAEAVALRKLPYLPLVHLNNIEIARLDTWHGWAPSPARTGAILFETQQQFLTLSPGPAPSSGSSTPVAAVGRASDGWLTTPRALLIGFALLAASILASAHLASGRRRVEPLEWTEE